MKKIETCKMKESDVLSVLLQKLKVANCHQEFQNKKKLRSKKCIRCCQFKLDFVYETMKECCRRETNDFVFSGDCNNSKKSQKWKKPKKIQYFHYFLRIKTKLSKKLCRKSSWQTKNPKGCKFR